MTSFGFSLLHQDKSSRARMGELRTPHGVIQTPAFTPVGTQGTVKSMTPEDLKTLGTQVFFVNTYHMYLRPGVEVVKKFGGLHTFIGWDGPLITDSGGFQVFSLGAKRVERLKLSVESEKKARKFVKIDDDGVTFQSHWDGSKHRFTPAKSIEIQHGLGADIILCFDDCTPYPVSRKQAAISMKRTHEWAMRCLNKHRKLKVQSLEFKVKNKPALYGIIQGSIYKDLREESARFISNLPFDGIAIGGVSVGESKKEMQAVLDWIVPLLPADKPRHLLGVGEIDDIFEIIERGIDTFDCVAPTRLARMGQVFKLKVKSEKLKVDSQRRNRFILDLTKKSFSIDMNPIDTECTCYTCQNFFPGVRTSPISCPRITGISTCNTTQSALCIRSHKSDSREYCAWLVPTVEKEVASRIELT